MTTSPEAAPQSPAPKEFQAIAKRAEAAGIASRLQVNDWIGDDEWQLSVDLPRGRSHRTWDTMEVDRARLLLSIPFENFRFLGDYDAVVDTSTGDIECRLTEASGRRGLSLRVRLRRLALDAARADSPTETTVDRSQANHWTIRLEHASLQVEISAASKVLEILLPQSAPAPSLVSIKLSGRPYENYGSSIALLEKIANAVLFELDLNWNIAALLGREPGTLLSQSGRRAPSRPRTPSFPTNQYLPLPLSLYFYARSATGLPLLAFLAYYQTIEYFFPIFTNREVLQSIRVLLRNPRFDFDRDEDASRLAQVAASGGSFTSERAQLRATVRACCDASDLRALISSNEWLKEAFCDRKQLIQGVQRLDIGASASDLRDQVADRIYAIRCRVVHTKGGGGSGEEGVELLLPSSKEAQALGPDIELARFVAQQALIASAERLRI